jgi:hypothetical protein
MFSASMPQFSGLLLASFAPSVRSKRCGSQVSRVMFSRAYTECLYFVGARCAVLFQVDRL